MDNSIYLVQTRLINFQSWLDMTMDFRNGLNVICAPNNNEGKSVFFKSIKMVTNPKSIPKEERTDFIRKGCSYAQVLHLFSDNVAYITKIWPNVNDYYIVEDMENVNVKPLGDTVPEDLINRLGIIIAGDSIPNMIDDEQKLFLINSDTESNSTALDLLVTHEQLNHLIENIEEDRLPKVKELVKSGKILSSSYESSMTQIKYVDYKGLEMNVDYSEKLLSPINSLIQSCEKLDSLVKVNEIGENIITLSELSSSMLDLDNLIGTLKPSNTFDSSVEDLLQLVEELKDINDSLYSIKNCKNLNPNLNELLNLAEFIELLKSNISRVTRVNDTDDSLVNDAESLNEILLSIKSVLNSGDLDKNIKEQVDLINSYGGENFTCPIHGNVKYIDGECIPCNN